MSLPQFGSPACPQKLQIDMEALCPASDRYRIFAQEIWPLLVRARAVLELNAYKNIGRDGVEPVWLLGVTVLQYWERVPDRQALELLRYHLGWNLALHRDMDAELFHPTVLAYFRERLDKHKLAGLVFREVLEGLVQAGLVVRRGSQRLDSTQMWGLVSQMSRLECLRETLRLALQELAGYQAMGRPEFWTALWEEYVQGTLDYRASASTLQAKMNQAGAQSARLLRWLQEQEQPPFGQGPQVQLLRRVLEEQFEGTEPESLQQRPSPPAGAVQNPHEPEAQWAVKGKGTHRKEHVGYKVQVGETVSSVPRQAGEPTHNFLTAVVTQPATGSDEAGLVLVEKELVQSGLLELPSSWYVDASYVSAQLLVQAREQGREVVGPAQPGPRKEGRYAVEDFDVCVEERRATCPAQKPSTQCSRLEEEATAAVSYRFEWSSHCHDCPRASCCLGAHQPHRSLVVGQYHSALQERRRQQKTPAYRLQMRRRNAIEGTQSELRRAHGLNRARYRGLSRVGLQNSFIGAACNIKRWIKLLIWQRTHGQSRPEQPAHPG